MEPRIGINMRAAPHSKTKLMFTFAEDLREVFWQFFLFIIILIQVLNWN